MNSALLIVDMQNDFLSGSLIVPGGLELVGPISDYAHRFKDRGVVYYSFCWHPKDHCSFEEQGGKWPAHCVQGTWGAELQCALAYQARIEGWQPVVKGSNAIKEEYSAFANPSLLRSLEHGRIKHLEICGVARNVCVEDTYQVAKRHVEVVEVVEALCASV